MISEPICLRVKGPFACFTMPEFHVERVSYQVITPSAARGILEAILMKPVEKPDAAKRHNKVGFRWVVTRIGVVRRGTFFSILRNEIQSEEGAGQNLRDGLSGSKIGYDISSVATDRSQRHSLILSGGVDAEGNRQMLEYLIEAVIEVPVFDGKRTFGHLKKYEGMFKRRAELGQCFYHPFFGCREFSLASWELVRDFDGVDQDGNRIWRLPDEVKQKMAHYEGENGDFGFLFHDFDFDPIWAHWPSAGRETLTPRPSEWPEFGNKASPSPNRLSGFHARAKHGWIRVPQPKPLKGYERSHYFADSSR